MASAFARMLCNYRQRNPMRTNCLVGCCRKSSAGKERLNKSRAARQDTWKKLCSKIPWANASGTRRAQRRSWASRQKHCWPSCARRGWKNSHRGLTPARVQCHSAHRPFTEIDGLIANGPQERGEFGWAEEAGDGFRQIRVGGLMAGDEPADSWENFRKIPAI